MNASQIKAILLSIPGDYYADNTGNSSFETPSLIPLKNSFYNKLCLYLNIVEYVVMCRSQVPYNQLFSQGSGNINFRSNKYKEEYYRHVLHRVIILLTTVTVSA